MNQLNSSRKLGTELETVKPGKATDLMHDGAVKDGFKFSAGAPVREIGGPQK